MKKSYSILQKIKYLLKNILFFPTSPHITRLIFNFIFKKKNRHKYQKKINLANINSVLIVQLNQVGDVVITAPFLRELRCNLPNAWITIVVLPTTLNIVEKCPYINEVVSSNWTGDRDLNRYQRHWYSFKLAQIKLWKYHFDLAILPRIDTDQTHGTFVAFFSGARLRIGYSDKLFGKNIPYFRNTDCLLTHVIKAQNVKHEVEYHLELIHYMGGRIKSHKTEVWLDPEDELYADQFIREYKVENNDILIAFSLGAGHPKRIWPTYRFSVIGSWLEKKYNARILVLGCHGEHGIAQILQEHLNGDLINAVGQTTLRQAAAMLKHCNLYVGNDSGLMHIAAATGITVVEISCHPQDGSPLNPSSPMRFGPWGVSHQILQPKQAVLPCTNSCIAQEAHCICDVTVDQVKEAIDGILSNQCQSKI